MPRERRGIELEEVLSPKQRHLQLAGFRNEKPGHQHVGPPLHDGRVTSANLETAAGATAAWSKRQGREVYAYRREQRGRDDRTVGAGIYDGTDPDCVASVLDTHNDDRQVNVPAGR